MFSAFKRYAANQSGASTAEFVLVLPLLAMLIFGLIYMSLMIYAASTLHYAVEDAARCYAVKRATCPDDAATQTYALGRYRGPAFSPALTTTSFVVNGSASCGRQVTVTNAQFRFRTGITNFAVPISATACFPKLS